MHSCFCDLKWPLALHYLFLFSYNRFHSFWQMRRNKEICFYSAPFWFFGSNESSLDYAFFRNRLVNLQLYMRLILYFVHLIYFPVRRSLVLILYNLSPIINNLNARKKVASNTIHWLLKLSSFSFRKYIFFLKRQSSYWLWYQLLL